MAFASTFNYNYFGCA